MFIGHFAPAFIAAAHVSSKSDARTPGLATFFIGAQLVDFGFFIFALADIEAMRITPGISAMNPMDLYHMPYTHSLAGTAVWALAFAAIVYGITRHTKGALLAGIVVLSHWFIDLLVHIPDLTIAGGNTKLGFSLWDHPWIAIPLELAFIGGAIFYYIRRTHAVRGTSSWALRILIAALLGLQAFNWFAPPPAEYSAEIPISALLAFTVLVLFALWADKTRTTTGTGNIS